MNKLPVSISPHLHSGRSSRGIMQDVIIALIPAVIASTIIFGFRALILIIVTVAACVISEYVTRKILKRPDSIHNLTAVVTGILLALNLPVTLPFWMAILGGVIAIVIVKEFFGGVGQNFVNPAITARIILMMSFASQMSTWQPPLNYYMFRPDVISSATYFSASQTGQKIPSLLDMFLGIRAGSLGETCAARRRLLGSKKGDFTDYSALFYRNSGHFFYLIRRRSVISNDVRRIIAGSNFYGDGLYNFTDYQKWQDYFWYRLRDYYRLNSFLRGTARRGFLCHFINEYFSPSY